VSLLHDFHKETKMIVKNRTKIKGLSLDLRGEGGYVLVPPSNHLSGKPYRFLISPDEALLAHAPDWLLDMVIGKPSQPIDVFEAGEFLDLATDPGAPEGQRHTEAARLIGAELGRGEDAEDVRRLAHVWGQRCSPPMDRGEIDRIVDDLARKEAEKAEFLTQEERRWPILDERVLHGLTGAIVQAIEPATEADPVAILVQLLVYFGNVIGRNAYYVVEATKHFTNLFTVVVGRTSKGRKGTSESWIRELFFWVEEGWTNDRIQAGLSSGEGLIWAVRDPIEKTEPIKDKGIVTGYQKVIVDPGIEDKRLLVRQSEFAEVLRTMSREGNTLTTTIRDAWDSGDLRTMTKNSPAKATGALISLVGHITVEELRQSIKEVEIFNGFANRFLWICSERSKLLPEGGIPPDLRPFIERLTKAVDVARAVRQLRRDDDSRKLWAEIYTDLSKDHPGLLGAVTSRSEAQVLRLSMIYALLDEVDP
jgi:hypothetical protein